MFKHLSCGLLLALLLTTVSHAKAENNVPAPTPPQSSMPTVAPTTLKDGQTWSYIISAIEQRTDRSNCDSGFILKTARFFGYGLSLLNSPFSVTVDLGPTLPAVRLSGFTMRRPHPKIDLAMTRTISAATERYIVNDELFKLSFVDGILGWSKEKEVRVTLYGTINKDRIAGYLTLKQEGGNYCPFFYQVIGQRVQ